MLQPLEQAGPSHLAREAHHLPAMLRRSTRLKIRLVALYKRLTMIMTSFFVL